MYSTEVLGYENIIGRLYFINTCIILPKSYHIFPISI